jgi:hypothetical protein
MFSRLEEGTLIPVAQLSFMDIIFIIEAPAHLSILLAILAHLEQFNP